MKKGRKKRKMRNIRGKRSENSEGFFFTFWKPVKLFRGLPNCKFIPRKSKNHWENQEKGTLPPPGKFHCYAPGLKSVFQNSLG